MTTQEILNLPMGENDANAKTIKEYLYRLLLKVWKENEGFNGKRPFGNSGWEWELYVPLVQAGLVEGNFDEDGYLEHVDPKAANELIEKCIRELFTQ